MIRKSFIIKKDNFFKLLNDKRISKIEVANSYNKSLNDKTLCKIYVYFKVENRIWKAGFMNAFQTIKIFLNANALFSIIEDDIKFLNEAINFKNQGFIKMSDYMKLFDIEKKYNIKLNIPKQYKKLDLIKY